jgi:digeranylgeranylglycerophospholipid reductase
LHDAIVIGGGPVGSHTAYKLAEMGYDALVLEQKEGLGERICCAGIISQECFSSFSIDSNIVLRQANSAKIFSPSGKLIRLWRQENQSCIVDRAAFNLSMANRAEVAGAEYCLESTVKDIQVKKDRVVVEAVQDGNKLNTEARVVVIATGFGSRLVDRLGLGKPGDFVIGAQAEVEARDIDEVEIYLGQEIAPGFFAWLVPTSTPRALVGLLSRRNPREYLEKLLSFLKASGKIDYNDEGIGCRGITIKPLKRTYGRRLMVVGDAAGQVKPTTGGGIYFGLLSSEIAAHNLNRALEKDDLSARSLAGYQREWKKKLGKELSICYWARRFYENLNDRQVDRIFDIIKDNGIDEALLKANELSFDWHGGAILKVAGQEALTKALATMKIPFQIGLG